MEDLTERQLYIERLTEAAQGTFWSYMGCQLESIEENRVVISLNAEAHHLNLIGIVHGGVLSSLLDNAMGIAVMAARPEEKTVTTNLNVHFVAPLKEGKLLVTAEILYQSRKMITTQGRVTDADGSLGTIGTGTFRII
jgi:uncharacterized protein (TIGR00369 family)